MNNAARLNPAQSVLSIERTLDDLARTSPCHARFALIYYHTIRHWQMFARDCEQKEELNLLIVRLYDKFDDYVLRLPQGTSQHVVQPWKGYLSAVAHHRAGDLLRTIGLLFAIRAHIRFDLAEAICATHDAYRAAHGEPPDMARFRALLLGRRAGRVFLGAWEDFVTSNSGGRAPARLAVRLLRPLSLLGLLVFQSARRGAWREASASIAADRPIVRAVVAVRLGRALG